MEGKSKLGSQEKGNETGVPTPADVSGKRSPAKSTGVERFESPTPLTLPLTKYERSRIVGSRALQVSLGAPVLVAIPPDATDPITIAEFELKANVLPITIRRKLPGGRQENIPLSKLPIEWG